MRTRINDAVRIFAKSYAIGLKAMFRDGYEAGGKAFAKSAIDAAERLPTIERRNAVLELLAASGRKRKRKRAK